MLAEIFDWWLNQMRSLIPGGVVLGGRQRDALIIAIDRLGNDENGYDFRATGSILLRRDGQEINVQPLDLAHYIPPSSVPHLGTGLRLPPGTVLCRDVLLPLAATRDLQTVIGFEMERLTPFSCEEVYWGVSGVTPDRARGRVSLQLSIALRAPIEALNQTLARIGLTPTFIETEAGRIDLGVAQPRRRLSLRAFLPALCGILFIACLATPFIHQQMALDAVAQRLASYQQQADIAQALRQRLVTAAAGRAAIGAARRVGDALQVLATLTDALPDGTWLSDMTLNAGDLTFDGQSDDAARLIGLLSTVRGLHDPSFTAPVTRTADGKADLFSMHVSVGP